ncbi:MAG: type II toxin-antitoxin system VapC family toxin [Rhodoferax sp.]|nr:type II toxin-antitoxin system VapC family toxin [Rhodoferax sp.]
MRAGFLLDTRNVKDFDHITGLSLADPCLASMPH